MELATAALGQLLPKLATLIADEYKLQKGVKGQIIFLRAEMERMQAALNRLSKLPPHQIDDLDRAWARDLKELVYDIEDSVDTLKMPACANRPQGSFQKILDRVTGLGKRSKTRHHAAVEMEEIKKRVQEVADRRVRYESPSLVVQHDTVQVHDPRLASPFEDKAKLVGVDGPTERITNWLTEEGKGQKRFIVSIVGMGGLGKTTIANLVYERLRREFQCQAFISVSLRPNMKRILSSILRQVSKYNCTNSGEQEVDELVRNIREFLSDKRYLIVIDDVWKKEDWKTIKCALVENNLGSRVIMTTRNVDVAAELSSVDAYTYELDPLSFEDSKRLLSTRVFDEDEGIHSELEEVVEKILNKCGGIPLAITTIASMLAVTPNKTKLEWYNVYKSMGSGLGKDKSLGNMRDILYLSYSDLPCYLKPCLLYLSVFPEDYEIERGTLIRMWAAEGLIDDKDGGYLYELGDRYFTELVNRSMIQPADTDWVGMVTSCRVHDMILDLIITISEQENFVTISGSPQLIPPNCKIRRLSLQGTSRGRFYYVYGHEEVKLQSTVPSTVILSHVRSLVTFGDASEWLPHLSRFSALRVLHIEEFPVNNNHLKDLGGLCNLRYLRLAGCSCDTVFLEEIGKLPLLKVLDVSALEFLDPNDSYEVGTMQLPASVVKLSQLEYLIINKEVELPKGIGNLMALKQLSHVSLKNSPYLLAEQSNLNRLRELSITVYGVHESEVKVFLQILSNLDNLRILIVSYAEDCIPDGWRAPAQLQIFDGSFLTFSRVPQCFCSLSELSVLSFTLKMLRQADLQLLGALPVLRFLRLYVGWDGATDERLVIGSDMPFRSLSRFVFDHGTGCCLEFTQGAMPKLHSLELQICAAKRKDGKFFVGLENLASLKKISVKLWCDRTRIEQVKDAESRIRDAIDIHPNHPALVISRQWEDCMIRDSEASDQDSEASDQDSEASERSSHPLSADQERDTSNEVSD